MDYSQIPQDSDHPADVSPWGTSPRRPARPTYSNSASESEPSSPLPREAHHGTVSAVGHGIGQETAADSEGAYGTRQSEAFKTNGTLPGSSTKPYGPIDTSSIGRAPQPSSRSQYIKSIPQQQDENHGKSAPSRIQSGTRPQQHASHYKLQAKITGLERTGRKDPILRFDIHTNLPKFRTTQFRDIRRTHSEFVKLAEHLISSNPEAFIPAVPPAVTSAGAGTDEDEARVKGSLQRWLNCICGNEVLVRDDEMVFFVESDFGYSPVIRMKQPATGVRRKMLKQFAPPPDDTPELHEARPIVKRFYLSTMDAGQKVDRVVKSRRGLGLAESDLGVKLAQMHVQETHQGLASAYRKLGRTIQTTGDYHAAQGTAEATTLSDPLNYYSNDALIVKETLTNRHILLRDLLSAQSATRSKLSAADRLKSSSSVRREKVDEAISALDEAKSHEQYLYQKTQRVTANLLLEKRKWFGRTATDLRTSIREYAIREIDAERRTLATLETVRPDIRAIDSSGGLSRLGREANPAARRASLAVSQGPRGDAWSGVQRRGDALSRSMSGGFGGVVPVLEEDGEDNRATGGEIVDTMLGKLNEEDDEDRVDARNAASRLATSTF